MKKFYVNDCPDNLSIFQWLYNETDMQDAIYDVNNNGIKYSSIIEIPHQLDIKNLIKDTKKVLNKFGTFGWKTRKGDSKAYGGLSMVYNPNLVESIDPNQNTLGTSENLSNEFYYGSTENFQSVKNTYFDSYGFRKLSPCIHFSNLKSFITDFNLSLTRSRIAVLDSSYHDRVGEDFLWHKDETIFENLRINIPIATDPSFLFQLHEEDPLHLEIGKIYTWDTHLPHRIYPTKKHDKKRIHLVLGFSPWFDYLEQEDAFIKNSYFGNLHPFEILLKNLAHPLIGTL